jgi:hypothetical protein
MVQRLMISTNTGLRYKGVEYHVGPTPDDVVVNLYNEQSYEITPLWNVIGVINGTISDEVISELPYDPAAQCSRGTGVIWRPCF